MGYLLVENFGEGLDSRRSLLTTKAGALLTCKNAHITRGKEIEKRKKFAEFASLPSNTFGLQAAGQALYVFGSIPTPAGLPATVNYQRLTHPSGSAMTELVASETFNGKIYAIAKFADGSIYHYFDGSRITTWDTVAASVASNAAVAASLAAQIDAEGNFDAIPSGSTFTVTGPTAKAFTATLSAVNGGSVNNQTLTQSTSQAARASSPATGPILSVALAASNLASQINADSHAHFTATVSGTTITITGLVGEDFTITPATTNGGSQAQAINVTTLQAASVTDPQISQAELTGAFEPNDIFQITLTIPAISHVHTYSVTTNTPAVTALPQITTITVGGTFEANDRFTVQLDIPQDSYSKQFSISASSSGVGTTARTFGDKVYSTTKSLLYFSRIGDATQWGGATLGSGFINITTQDGGAENLTALGVYQGRLAVFSRRSVQIWAMDADPNNNVRSQTLENIGTFAPRSVVAFGDIDVFFLSDSGIRSLRARDSSNAATVSDIGTSIDTLIQSEMLSVDETVRNAAVGIIEPSDGRYWLALNNKIYVFSFFPASKVSAWSTYETGFSISHMVYASGRIYARSGAKIYLYGGLSGNEYDDCEVEVTLPFLDGEKPAHTKTIQAIDMACENAWQVEIGTDVAQPNSRVNAGTVTNSSYSIGRLLHFGIGTHVGAKLKCQADGYARLGNLAIHYTIADSE